MWKSYSYPYNSCKNKKKSFNVILILLPDSFLFLFKLPKPNPKSVPFWFWLHDWNYVRNFKLWMNFTPGRIVSHHFQQLQNTLHTTFQQQWGMVEVRIICGNFAFHKQALIWSGISQQQLLLFSDWFRKPFIEQRIPNWLKNWHH